MLRPWGISGLTLNMPKPPWLENKIYTGSCSNLFEISLNEAKLKTEDFFPSPVLLSQSHPSAFPEQGKVKREHKHNIAIKHRKVAGNWHYKISAISFICLIYDADVKGNLKKLLNSYHSLQENSQRKICWSISIHRHTAGKGNNTNRSSTTINRWEMPDASLSSSQNQEV